MKYISELDVLAIIESLERKLEVNPSNPINNALYGQAGAIYSFRQELDQLIVSKLRPMSEAPRDGELILVCLVTSNEMIQSFYYIRGNAWSCDTGFYKDNELKGWIPMPKYKPEE